MSLLVIFPSRSASALPSPGADYRFQNKLSTSVGTAPALQKIGPGTNTFTTATVDGSSRTVLRFPEGNGLKLSPTTGVVPNNTYTIVVLFELNEVGDNESRFRRVLDFKNGTSDSGLYVKDGRLSFYRQGIGSVKGTTPIAADRYVQVVVNRDASKQCVVFFLHLLDFSVTYCWMCATPPRWHAGSAGPGGSTWWSPMPASPPAPAAAPSPPAGPRAVFETNVTGVLNTALPAIEAMAEQAPAPDGLRGRIAVIASVAAFVAAPGAPAYCASKAAVQRWAEALDASERRRGIRLHAVCPGYIRTPMTARTPSPCRCCWSRRRRPADLARHRRGPAADRLPAAALPGGAAGRRPAARAERGPVHGVPAKMAAA